MTANADFDRLYPFCRWRNAAPATKTTLFFSRIIGFHLYLVTENFVLNSITLEHLS